MLVSCDKCNASYAIPANKIGSGGKRLKCVKCGNIWLVLLPAEKLEEPKQPAEEMPQVSMPILSRDSFSRRSSNKVNDFMSGLLSMAAFLVLLVATSVLFYPKIYNASSFMKNIYDKLGYNLNSSIILTNLSVSKSIENESMNLNMKGNIFNSGNKTSFVPLLRVVVKDVDCKIILSHIITPDQLTLDPGGKILLDNSIKNLAKSAVFLELDLGNKLELLLR